MTIVLNEHDWAREKIESQSLGAKPFETLSRVAKYYIDKNYSKKETRSMLDTFLLRCDPAASLPKWSDTLDNAVSKAMKYDAIEIDSIEISKAEIDIIDTLEGKQTKRLAFTLLCLAKYWNMVNPNSNSWVNSKDSEIMRMANINTSIKRQSLMYHNLREAGLIQFSKKVDNTNVRVCFITPGDTALRITDFRNLGYQYLQYNGEPYFECINCGITTKYSNPSHGLKQKYCKECAAKIAAKQKLDSAARLRQQS